MPGWVWVLIVVAALVVVAIVVWQAMRQRRSRTFRRPLRPGIRPCRRRLESKRRAESELAARADRRDKLEITPLPPGARERYALEWQRVQARFVDDPEGAVRESSTRSSSV